MSITTCRSPQEINDDDLIDAHEMLTVALAERDSSRGGYWYRGAKRDELLALHARVERCITEGTPFGGRVMPAYLAAWTIAS